jgi:hypothetical protein
MFMHSPMAQAWSYLRTEKLVFNLGGWQADSLMFCDGHHILELVPNAGSDA